MVSSGAAAALPILAELKQASERWVRRERARARFTSGVQALDGLLGGGWPQGKVGELVGPASSGRSAVAAATVAAATARGEVTAWLDAADAFDPASAAAAGVDLGRVLWVRTRDAVETVRAAELVLETGGFTVVVLDLGSAVHAASRRDGVWERKGGPCGRPGRVGASPTPTLEGARKGALRLRLARAVERAGAVALVLAERPWAGTLAGTMVALRRGEARWAGERGGPLWLDGLVLRAQVERGGSRDRAAEPREERNIGMALTEADSLDVGPAPATARGLDEKGTNTTTGGGKPRPYEDVPAHVSVGRALRACPEDAGGSAREHARSVPSTEMNGPDVEATLAAARESDVGAKDRVPGDTHETPVIARSPGLTGATKQSRCSSPACGGGSEGAQQTAACALTPALSHVRERVDGQGGDTPRPCTDEAGVETALGA